MGDCVGELFYGVQVSEEDYNRIQEKYEDAVKNGQYVVDQYGVKIPCYEHGCDLNWPYETEECFIVIKDSQKAAYNGSTPLEPEDMVKKAEWDEQLKAFCRLNGVEKFAYEGHRGIDDLVPCWFLVGRYD